MKDNFKIDFIGIGAGKSGTTWLSSCLALHPQICLSEPKEINYFNYADIHRFHQKKSNVNKNNTKPFSWYQKHFKHCRKDAIKGEFSVSYMIDEKAPLFIKQRFPNIKLLACLRNPIDRAYSHYWAAKSYRKIEKKSFEAVIKDDSVYIQHGFYQKYLNRYLKYFNKDQILIILLDDILSKPEEVAAEVYNFLNVSNNVNISLRNTTKNTAMESRFSLMEPIMRHFSNFLINAGQARLLHAIRKLGAKKLFIQLSSRRLEYPEMKSETRKYLGNIFKKSNRELGEFLQRDLSYWI